MTNLLICTRSANPHKKRGGEIHVGGRVREKMRDRYRREIPYSGKLSREKTFTDP